MNKLKNYNTFIIDNYSIDLASLKATFNYSLDNKIHFKEEIEFPKIRNITEAKIHAINTLLPHLHIMLGISYFKSENPKNIAIKNNFLNKKQASFFNKVYNLGLGEYAYKNQITVNANFDYKESEDSPFICENKLEDKILLPIGGGKDSLVSLELIRKLNKEFILFYVGDSFLIKNFCEKHSLNIVYIKRKICKNLLELNKQGALNGHIPITAINSFLSLITAQLLNIKNIYFSNERSASVGNVSYNEKVINHQYSKSFEFESDFREFVKDLGFSDINYASILRPVSELLVFKKFSKLKKYFNSFSSCNTNFKINDKKNAILWCGKCPKCAFVYVMLAQFLKQEELNNIFSKDLFDDKKLIELFEELSGFKNFKPFECVGEIEEVKISFKKLFSIKEYKNTIVVKYFYSNYYDEITKISEEKYLKVTKEHNLSEELIKLITKELK